MWMIIGTTILTAVLIVLAIWRVLTPAHREKRR
jgi:hypothetical protein